MIVSFEAWQVEIPLKLAFKHAAFEHRSHRCVFIRLNTKDKKIFGLGECIPRSYLTGENLDEVMDWLCDKAPQWFHEDFTDIDTFLKKLHFQYQEASHHHHLAASSGLDIALYDLCSRLTEIPLLNLLRSQLACGERMLPRGEISLNGPIGLSFGQKSQISGLMALGFRRFKVKIASLEGWEKIRTWIRTLNFLGFEFIVDCNGAFDFEEARIILAQASHYGVKAVEEPLKRGEHSLGLLKTLAKEFAHTVTVIVDEHLCGLDDGLFWQDVPVQRNFRLAKNGGFTGVLNHLKLLYQNLADSHELPEGFCGSLVGEGLLMERAAHVMRAFYRARYVDPSWGSLLLKANPHLDTNPHSASLKMTLLDKNKFKIIGNRAMAFDLSLWESSRGLGVSFDEALIKPFCNRYERKNA